MFAGFRKTLVALAMVAGSTHAAPGAEVSLSESHSSAALLTAADGVAPGSTVRLGFTVSPRDHWHSYWLNPGDSGQATILDWELPKGVTISAPDYPVPGKLPVGPLMNYGYDGDATILMTLAVPKDFTSSEVKIGLDAEWLVCEIECVPQMGRFDITLPVGATTVPSDEAVAIRVAESKLPEPAWWDSRVTLEGDTATTLTVMMSEEEATEVTEAYFYPASEGVVDYAAPQTFKTGAEGLILSLQRSAGAPRPETGKGILTLSLADGTSLAMMLDADLSAAPVMPNASAPAVLADAMPLWQAALFALVGGLVLNLMPCVFPILSLKAFSLAKCAGKADAHHRMEGLAYTAGILTTFLAIAGVLLALRAGGAAIGWGFQLQEPIFVALMAMLMLVLGLSLAGFINISTGFEGAGQELAASGGAKGAYFTGVLATLVATPCTAPLMGPAVGFALTQPAVIGLITFLMLGLGMALPFLVLCFSPAAMKRLPKPGPWMNVFKEALAFPMFATALWLVYVFSQQTGIPATFGLLLAMLVLALALWIWRTGTKGFVRGLALSIGAVSLALVIWTSGARVEQKVAAGDNTVAYSAAALEGLLADGGPVFVYFTADWCITCKVNERVALDRDDTQALIAERGIKVVKGDWTNRNAEIAAVLAAHGRAGVPLYLFYPAGARNPIVLPEILTPGGLQDVLAGRQTS